MSKNNTENLSQKQSEALSRLTLFAGISDTLLQKIFSEARVLLPKEGEVLFMQDTKRTHVYILLKGMIRLFKGSEEGNEITFEIAAKGNTFLEAITLVGPSYLVSAHVLKPSEIVAIPEAVIRQASLESHAFACNMLSLSEIITHALVSHVEQLTLKSASQRVGWFLLRLFLENGEYSRNFQLPYDKLLIASYLGMKPETFSRTLQQLKEQGIYVERNNVSLSDAFALCSYCSSDNMQQCGRTHSPECKFYGH